MVRFHRIKCIFNTNSHIIILQCFVSFVRVFSLAFAANVKICWTQHKYFVLIKHIKLCNLHISFFSGSWSNVHKNDDAQFSTPPPFLCKMCDGNRAFCITWLTFNESDDIIFYSVYMMNFWCNYKAIQHTETKLAEWIKQQQTATSTSTIQKSSLWIAHTNETRIYAITTWKIISVRLTSMIYASAVVKEKRQMWNEWNVTMWKLLTKNVRNYSNNDIKSNNNNNNSSTV